MLAFGMYLLQNGAAVVELHPDGEHGKQYDFETCLAQLGYCHVVTRGTTRYGGEYSRGEQKVYISPKSGLGDVVAQLETHRVLAECKGGVVNSRHTGQLSRLRRGLCEAVGLLMTRRRGDNRYIAVVPATAATRAMARQMISQTLAAGIEIALVDGAGDVTFIESTAETELS